MPKSTITSKYQTTVPREVRERLRLGTQDVLIWEIDGDGARVRPAARRFLELRGSIKVGPGSSVEDVLRARHRAAMTGVDRRLVRKLRAEEIAVAEL